MRRIFEECAAIPWCWRATCRSCRRTSAAYPGRILNIHHSFLPSFVGAKPYHQAYAKGVKLIGATCHYVTADLDQGPIIEQDVIRIDHLTRSRTWCATARDIEKTVLAAACATLEDRVLVHGNKTIVFPLMTGAYTR